MFGLFLTKLANFPTGRMELLLYNDRFIFVLFKRWEKYMNASSSWQHKKREGLSCVGYGQRGRNSPENRKMAPQDRKFKSE